MNRADYERYYKALKSRYDRRLITQIQFVQMSYRLDVWYRKGGKRK